MTIECYAKVAIKATITTIWKQLTVWIGRFNMFSSFNVQPIPRISLDHVDRPTVTAVYQGWIRWRQTIQALWFNWSSSLKSFHFSSAGTVGALSSPSLKREWNNYVTEIPLQRVWKTVYIQPGRQGKLKAGISWQQVGAVSGYILQWHNGTNSSLLG